MNDVVEWLFSEESLHSRLVSQICHDETKPSLAPQLGKTSQLEIYIIVGVHVVQSQHLLPFAQKPLGNVEPNKARTACYQNFLSFHMPAFPLGFELARSKFTAEF